MKRQAMGGSERELELALVVVSRNPNEVLQEIGEMGEIGPYRLIPALPQRIRDRYFDTRKRLLRSRNLALRIRVVNSSLWITLKGNLEVTQAGNLRLEIERPWSEGGFEKICQELEQRQIVPPVKARVFQSSEKAAMEALGFFPIQERYTFRQIRHIHLHDQGGTLSELALDRVTYVYPHRHVYHHEVEIEAKEDNKGTSLEVMGEVLLTRFGKTLRRWPYNKLATGLAIGRMLSGKEKLKGLLDSDGCLLPEAYERVAEIANWEENSP